MWRGSAHTPSLPKTGIAAPEMSRAASDNKNAITPLSDSTLTHWEGSRFGIAARLAGVSIVLGSTALMRTPSASTSAAQACTNAMTAAFDAAYAAAREPSQG